MRKLLASVLVIGLSAGAIEAADTYAIKLYTSKKGDKTDHVRSEKSQGDIVANIGGATMKESNSNGRKEVFTEEILEKAAGTKRATKLTRTYTVAEKTEKGETTKTVYAGQTVLIEKKGDKYEFSIKGKALDESDAPELFKKFNEEKDDEPGTEDFLPADPVEVGASWKVSADNSARMFKSLEDKMKIDADKSGIEGKLLKVYTKAGSRFGVLEFTFTMFVTEIESGGQFIKTAGRSKIVLKGTIEACIDGTVNFEDANMGMALDVTIDISETDSVTIQGTTTILAKASPAKK